MYSVLKRYSRLRAAWGASPPSSPLRPPRQCFAVGRSVYTCNLQCSPLAPLGARCQEWRQPVGAYRGRGSAAEEGVQIPSKPAPGCGSLRCRRLPAVCFAKPFTMPSVTKEGVAQQARQALSVAPQVDLVLHCRTNARRFAFRAAAAARGLSVPALRRVATTKLSIHHLGLHAASPCKLSRVQTAAFCSSSPPSVAHGAP